MAKTNILLESGTNEMEIMKFTICDELYGINVAKVREIMIADKIKPVPRSHPMVEGIFKPRDVLLTIVDLPRYLTGESQYPEGKELLMVTSFNQMDIAFRVHSVVGIQRISWADIKKPDKTLNNGEEGIATGIAESNGELVVILDFEKIVAEIAPETSIDLNEVEEVSVPGREIPKIILAEDSEFLAKLIQVALTKAGYTNFVRYNNAYEAWKYLQSYENNQSLKEHASLIITDIEMPEMDGHRLTRLVKEHKILNKIPIIIFSSLINEEMEIKGRQLGADTQLSKPEIGLLVESIDVLLQKWE